LGGLLGLLLMVTLVWREWIEILFSVNPDDGNGMLEWLIVAFLVLATLSCFLIARIEWNRMRQATIEYQ
jgi:hypothetical protein